MLSQTSPHCSASSQSDKPATRRKKVTDFWIFPADEVGVAARNDDRPKKMKALLQMYPVVKMWAPVEDEAAGGTENAGYHQQV